MDDNSQEYVISKLDYAIFRPTGTYTFDEAVDLINRALEYCRSRTIRKLLVNILDVTGFPPPNTIQRFVFATTWAETAKGKVVLAMVAPEKLIDPEKIGVTVAYNRGFETEVFTVEDEAVQWLTTF